MVVFVIRELHRGGFHRLGGAELVGAVPARTRDETGLVHLVVHIMVGVVRTLERADLVLFSSSAPLKANYGRGDSSSEGR